MTYITEIPGLPGGPLHTIAPVKIKLIPAWRTNNRPGIKASKPRRSIQHGNGNPNSTAAGEAQYLYNGAEGRQASYHSSTDDKETWVMLPADEVSWQAADGAGPGNMSGFSNESIEDSKLWADPTRRDALIANVADFMGGVAARLGIDAPEQHWDFNWRQTVNRHDCPNKLRYTKINGRLAWDIYVEKWREAKENELRRMTGGEVGPQPQPDFAYPDPIEVLTIASRAEIAPATIYDPKSKVTFLWVGDRVRTKVVTGRYRWATEESPRVGVDIPIGTTFDVDWIFLAGDGQWWYYTPWAIRVKAKDTERISDAKAA